MIDQTIKLKIYKIKNYQRHGICCIHQQLLRAGIFILFCHLSNVIWNAKISQAGVEVVAWVTRSHKANVDAQKVLTLSNYIFTGHKREAWQHFCRHRQSKCQEFTKRGDSISRFNLEIQTGGHDAIILVNVIIDVEWMIVYYLNLYFRCIAAIKC